MGLRVYRLAGMEYRVHRDRVGANARRRRYRLLASSELA